MKMMVLTAVALLVLGGGGTGAYFYFMAPDAEAASGATAEHAEAEKAGDHGEGHGKSGHYKYVELEPLILPIVDEYGVSQVVSLVLSLEVADDAAAKKVENMQPRLTDAYIQNMYGLLNQHAAASGGVIQVGSLKKQLNKISQKVMGENVVNDVLLQVVQQRPI